MTKFVNSTKPNIDYIFRAVYKQIFLFVLFKLKYILGLLGFCHWRHCFSIQISGWALGTLYSKGKKEREI